ncbi:hypothetical protein PCAR4_430024 [Paraburkholderia caribensis]|nr:hypothetical protein PCAR4_430024 [Paraburkholderia caribensis]
MRRRKGAGASSLPVSLTIVSSCLIVSLCAASRFILAARVAIHINASIVSLHVPKVMLRCNGMVLALVFICSCLHKRH